MIESPKPEQELEPIASDPDLTRGVLVDLGDIDRHWLELAGVVGEPPPPDGEQLLGKPPVDPVGPGRSDLRERALSPLATSEPVFARFEMQPGPPAVPRQRAGKEAVGVDAQCLSQLVRGVIAEVNSGPGNKGTEWTEGTEGIKGTPEGTVGTKGGGIGRI
jgi:hypothetical protein